MTGNEKSELAALRDEMREEFRAVRADIGAVKTEMAEWRGMGRFVKAAAGFVGLGGLALFVRALAP